MPSATRPAFAAREADRLALHSTKRQLRRAPPSERERRKHCGLRLVNQSEGQMTATAPRRAEWATALIGLCLPLIAAACGPGDEPVVAADTSGAAVDAAADAESADAPAPACVLSQDCVATSLPCQGWSCTAGQCVAIALPDGAICEGADRCHPGVCASGVCDAKPRTCAAPTNTCRQATCDPADGACKESNQPDGAACDDGLPCTDDDACAKGTCGDPKASCQCKSDDDCAGREDDNPCNGKLYCDASKGACAVNASTVVVCPTTKDTACVKNTCAPSTGECALVAVDTSKGAVPCEDGEACTTGDHCVAGKCAAGVQTCCKSAADCSDDGDACNGLPFCNAATSKCQVNPATAVVCPSAFDTECSVNTCDKVTGKCAQQPVVATNKTCDDGNPCTTGETCAAGACEAAANVCVCTKQADCAAKEDGDLCNGTLFCDLAVGKCQLNPATKVSCQTVDNTPCKKNTCQPKTGKCALLAMADGAPCTDGNACTVGDACAKGVCTPATTAEACECQVDADCAKFEDGNLCNGVLVCNKAAKTCIVDQKTIVYCPSAGDTECSKNACLGSTGKCAQAPASLNSPCDDGQPCLVGSVCGESGTCGGGTPKGCDDGNSCTADACDDKGVCTHKTLSGAACTLANASAGLCTAGVCVAKPTCPLFMKPTPLAGSWYSTITKVIPLASGGHASAGLARTKAGKWRPRVVGRDDVGQQTWLWQESGATHSDGDVAALFDADDGGALDDGKAAVLVVGSTGTGLTLDGVMWRIDAKGKLVETKKFGGAQADALHNAIAWKDGLIAVGGSATKSNGKQDCWILRTKGASPTLTWEKRFGGAKDDVCWGVDVREGAIVAAGHTASQSLDADVYVVVVDEAGKVQWKKHFGGTGTQRVLAMRWRHDGSLLGVGTTVNFQDTSGYVIGLTSTGVESFAFTSKTLLNMSDLVTHANGTATVLGDGGAMVSDGTKKNYVRSLIIGRLSAKGKVTQHAEIEHVASTQQRHRMTLDGDRVLLGGAMHDDLDGDKIMELRGVTLSTDAWGRSTCPASGACLQPAYTFCDDGDGCTTDGCDPKSGCTHGAGTCAPAWQTEDLDHDGLIGTKDPCPSVWNPQGDKGACAALSSKLSESQALILQEPGAKAGYSSRRRSNELVQIPLRNGVVDPSVVAWWRFDGNTTDSSGNGHHLIKAAGSYLSAVTGTSGYNGREKDNATESTDLALPTLRELTYMTWARTQPDGDKDSCDLFLSTRVDKAQGTTSTLGVQIDDDGALRVRFGKRKTGASGGPTHAVVRSADGAVAHGSGWHHVAVVVREDLPMQLFLDGQGVETVADGGAPTTPGVPISLQQTKVADEDVQDCTVHLDDTLLFSRPLNAQEINLYAGSTRPFATSLLKGAHADFRALTVSERAPWDKAPRSTLSEVVGRRPYGVTNLKGVAAYWTLDAKTGAGSKNEVTGKVDATWSDVQSVDGPFGGGEKAARFNGKTSVITVKAAALTLTDLTAEAWFRVASDAKGRLVILDTRSKATADGLALIVDATTTPGLFELKHTLVAGGTALVADATVDLHAGWHHTTLRRKAGLVEIALDGVRLGAKWSGSTILKPAVKVFGPQPARIGTDGVNAFAGDIAEVLIHSVGVHPNDLARRVIGPPRVRFFAHTSAAPAMDGYLYHRYALRWGDPLAVAKLPDVQAAPGTSGCSSLISACTGYAGLWRFSHGFLNVAIDEGVSRRHGVYGGGGFEQGGAAVFATSAAQVAFGAWGMPFYNAGSPQTYTIEWQGTLTTYAAGNTSAVVFSRQGGGPAFGVQDKTWAHALDVKTQVTGPTATLLTPHTITASLDAKTKVASLTVDGGPANTVSNAATTSGGSSLVHLGADAGANGHSGRVTSLRIMNRLLAPDEIGLTPASVWSLVK